MFDGLFVRDDVLARLASSPVVEHLAGFVAALQQQGYATETVRRYVCAADVFVGSAIQGCRIGKLDEATLVAYVEGLGRLRHPRVARGRLHEAAFGVRRFVEYLRERGVIRATSTRCRTEGERWLRSFDQHLEVVSGLSRRTRESYSLHVRRLLAAQFGDGRVDWQRFTAQDVERFIRQQAAKARPSACGSPLGVVTATRRLLRFLVFQGAVPPGMECAVPTVRRARLAALPKHLSPREIRDVLSTCSRHTPTGHRDRAVLLLLCRLGLRASEVMQIQLDDVDWRQGRLVIRTPKGGRMRWLPLPHDVGGALVAYLKKGRPSTPCRSVFVRMPAPHRPFKYSAAVSAIVHTHLRLAGVPMRGGAHLLRHSAATQMVRSGVSFKEVADVLGHRLLETTAIYAKLDLARLAKVALPWPAAS